MKPFALQLYRLAVVAMIAWLIRDLAVRQRTHGDSPVAVDEVKSFFPSAANLRPDDSARDGLFVRDRDGRELGYVVRTQPQCQDIIGYAGATDVLVVLDRDWKIVGLKIHASDDTADYVTNIAVDRRFLKKWHGLAWTAAADLDLQKAGIEGVSGATMTSMAIARSVKARLQMNRNEIVARPALRFAWRDWGMIAVLVLAVVMAFGRPEWRHRWKRPYQILLVVYVGFVAGDLLAMKLLAGWARSGVPWSTAPGLVLLAAAALVVPWATRKPIYCHHICPHGAAQELLWQFRVGRAFRARPIPQPPAQPGADRPAHLTPSPFRSITLPAGVIRACEYLPAGLLLLTLIVAVLALPLDLAGIEPFAAYVVRSAGWATLAVAGVGLIASFFVPQAYCRFGCPTGTLLNFVRARGPTDRFSRRDGVALFLLIVAAALNWQYLSLIGWMKGVT
ncbi:MAG: 4Fe-4S binding protein [Opitutus sp.]|nr:4Fe-4S binding protein [Opitutus sp.]